MKKKLSLIFLILILILVLYFTFIARSLNKFHKAIYNNNEQLISETINFESIKKNLKEDINANMLEELNKDESSSQAMNLLAIGFVSKIADMVIDVYASPKGVSTLLKESDLFEELPEPNLLKSYLAINKFRFNGINEIFYELEKDESKIPIHFRRDGIEWKLVKIKLDPKKLNVRKQQ